MYIDDTFVEAHLEKGPKGTAIGPIIDAEWMQYGWKTRGRGSPARGDEEGCQSSKGQAKVAERIG